MNRQQSGLTLFWIGTIYMLIAAGVGGWGEPAIVVRASQAVGQTAFFLWAFSVPIGLTLAGIGALLYVGAKGSRIAFFGVGIVLTVFLVDMVLRMYLVKTDSHFHSVFGIGGGLILIMFAGLLRLWAEKRKRQWLIFSWWVTHSFSWHPGSFAVPLVPSLVKGWHPLHQEAH